MKTINRIKKISVTIFIMTLMLTIATAQSRYKHVPRVRVDLKHTVRTVENPTVNSSVTTMVESVNLDSPVSLENAEIPVDETMVASTSEEEAVMPSTKTKRVIHPKKAVKRNKMTNEQLFTRKVKEKSKLMDIKEATRTNANIPLILLIIFYVLAFVFILIAVLMILGYIYTSFTVFLIFLIIGITFALAASVLLSLIKFGLI